MRIPGVVSLLFIAAICEVLGDDLPKHQHDSESLRGLKINISREGLSFNLTNNKQKPVLDFLLKNSDHGQLEYQKLVHTKDNLKMRLSNGATINLRYFPRSTSRCYELNVTEPNTTTENCFGFGDAYWYGGSEMRVQKWPLNTVNVSLKAYVVRDCLKDMFGSVSERYFLASVGVAFWFDEDQPLFASINDNGNRQICFNVNNTTPYQFDPPKPLIIRFEFCSDTDIVTVHKTMRDAHFPKPSGIPNERMFRQPIWSTWTQFLKNVNQSLMLEYIDSILEHNLTISHLGIDDKWTVKYGDFAFDETIFPNPAEMISQIHSKNIPVIMWIHPFINTDSSAYGEAAQSGYFVRDPSGQIPALTKWWDGSSAGIIDFTNPKAADWYLFKLNGMKIKYGIDSYKFDAGETTYLPTIPFKLYNDTGNPDAWVEAYARTAAKVDSENRQEIRIGVRTQDLPLMVRILDRNSSWTYEDGLKTLIPACLTLGILGYPFVLADFVGGSLGGHQDAELFIRWVQATALMPFMELSYVPWAFKDATVEKVTKDMISLHEQYGDKLIALAKDSMSTGDPIMRPMWWIAPNDVPALTTDSQFMVGDDLLVAPVLDKGATHKQIYLPTGIWRDEITHQHLRGPTTLDYPVTIEDLPRFTQI